MFGGENFQIEGGVGGKIGFQFFGEPPVKPIVAK
jgi:hypothetical protein